MNKSELIKELESRGIREEILKVIKNRSKDFVSEKDFNEAYENHPLSIGYGQTISQPYTVALCCRNWSSKKAIKFWKLELGADGMPP